MDGNKIRPDSILHATPGQFFHSFTRLCPSLNALTDSIKFIRCLTIWQIPAVLEAPRQPSHLKPPLMALSPTLTLSSCPSFSRSLLLPFANEKLPIELRLLTLTLAVVPTLSLRVRPASDCLSSRSERSNSRIRRFRASFSRLTISSSWRW